MNYVLGSGLIGCLACEILPNWQLIPFKRSRYYSFEIPLAEPFIKRVDAIDEVMCKFSFENKIPIIEKNPISFGGQLIFQDNNDVKMLYLKKVYGDDYPTHFIKLLPSTYSIYPMGPIQLYQKLQEKLKPKIDGSIVNLGTLIGIDLGRKELIFKEGRKEFETIISTIPLDVLAKLCRFELELKSKAVCYYRIGTNKIDLEGARQCLVADGSIDFFRVVKLPIEHEYLFWTWDKLENPYEYFGKFLGYNLDLIEAARVDKAIPIGPRPDLSELEMKGIYCVGSNAEHDDMMCVGSCMSKILRLTNK
jgi:hypothetical protein